jgi:hypothetical protein
MILSFPFAVPDDFVLEEKLQVSAEIATNRESSENNPPLLAIKKLRELT